jgi:protein-tyrosine phosphatase
MERVISLGAVHNFRDLGGYPATGGGTTAWRRLYRSDGLARLAGVDLEVVRGLGVHSVLDLRTARELDERGGFPLAEHPVHFHHLPMIDVTWGLDEGPEPGRPVWTFLHRKYAEMLAEGELWVARAFHTLAVPGAFPAVFHCAAGKDRTGILAALLLSSLGVPDEHVVADYALTGAAMDRMRAWAAVSSPELAEALRDHPAAHLAAEPEAIARLLTDIRDGHGSVTEYLRSIGITLAVLARLREELVVPARRATAAA